MCFSTGRKLSASLNVFMQLGRSQVPCPDLSGCCASSNQVTLYPSFPHSCLGTYSLLASDKCLDGNRKEMHRLRLIKLMSC